MKLSQYLLPVLKEAPREAQIVSHQLMLRAGMILQQSAGIYNWLPLGLCVLDKIADIVREEMEATGYNELLMPTIQSAELWQESGRYDAYGKEMLRMTDRHDRPLLYGPTNEEVVTDIFRRTTKSYKELPRKFYHIQWKFRDEIRPRFGVMRGREFLMKDAYHFALDADEARACYIEMYEAYLRTFKRMGLQAIPVRAVTGQIGGDLSHEFHVLAETGESDIFYDKQWDSLLEKDRISFEESQEFYAAEEEYHEPEQCGVAEADLRTRKGIEVGHIFNFGTKYTESMKADVQDKDGKAVAPYCGSHGIGVSRLVGAIIEASHDENGIIWPEPVAPFKVGLMNLKPKDEACLAACDDLYAKLNNAGIEVLYDDRDLGAGQKFATMDLIGLPYQVAIGPRSAKEGKAEFKDRKTGEKQEILRDEVIAQLAKPVRS